MLVEEDLVDSLEMYLLWAFPAFVHVHFHMPTVSLDAPKAVPSSTVTMRRRRILQCVSCLFYCSSFQCMMLTAVRAPFLTAATEEGGRPALPLGCG